jgi:hypothetical protein
MKTKRETNLGTWLGFKRLARVPIQIRMVNDKMLGKEEKRRLKVMVIFLRLVHTSLL